jgi:hypothetical protein
MKYVSVVQNEILAVWKLHSEFCPEIRQDVLLHEKNMIAEYGEFQCRIPGHFYLFPRFICYPISLQKSSWEFTLSLYFSAND